MRDETIDRLLKQVADIGRQLRALQRLDVSPPPSSIVTYSGTPNTGQLAQWGGAGTLTHSGYAGSAVARYSGAPTAGAITYWTGNGTVAPAGYGTADLPRYSGTPTAGAIAHWTGAGTVADAGFGTADVVTLAGTQTLAAKTLTTPTIASFTNATHNHADAAGGGQITTAALSDLSTLVQTTGDQSVAGVKTFSDGIEISSDEFQAWGTGVRRIGYNLGGITSGVTTTYTVTLTYAVARVQYVTDIMLTMGVSASVNRWGTLSRRVCWRTGDTVGNNGIIMTNVDLGTASGSDINFSAITAIANGIQFTAAVTTGGTNAARDYLLLDIVGNPGLSVSVTVS